MWADVVGYEGRYQVSTLGRVKSLARMRRGKGGSEVPMPEKIMALTTKKNTGRTKPYVEVRFRNGGARTEKCKSFLVHRLVADAFIKRLETGEQVDHINGVHYDNRVENLRVMHFVEHGRAHPSLSNGLLQKSAQLALQKKRENGWVSGQYERSNAHRKMARLSALANPKARDEMTGRFLSGMPGPMKDDKGRPTRKAASLKRWNCK